MISCIVILLAAFVGYFSLRPPASSAAWFDGGYGYRQKVTVTNVTGSPLTDMQVSINLDTAALVTANKLQSDCDDVRITDVNGKTLPIWIESGKYGCNTTNTYIWIKVPTLPSSGATLYFYYGNPSASTASNGNETFVFFDDFNGTSLDSTKWSEVNTTNASTTVSGGVAKINGPEADWWSTADTAYYIITKTAFGSSYVAEAGINSIDLAGQHPRFIGLRSGPATNEKVFAMLGDQDETHVTTMYRDTVGGSANYYGENTGSVISTTPYRNSFVVNGDSVTAYHNGPNLQTRTVSGFNLQYIAITDTEAGSTGTNVDWVFVRKYASTQPTSSLGSEETTPDPIMEWRFDEGSGSTAQDSSANNKDGTITGAGRVNQDQCVLGRCVYFDGTNDVITGNSSVANVKAVEFWVKVVSTAGTEQLLDLNGTDYLTSVSGTVTAAGFGTETIYVDGVLGTSLQPDQWHHVAVVSDSSMTASAIKIGQISTNYGQIFADDIKFFNYARSATQVQNSASSALVNSTLTSSGQLSQDLISYWKFDESALNTCGTVNDACDSSGNGNVMSLLGSIYLTGGKFGHTAVFDGTGDYYCTNANDDGACDDDGDFDFTNTDSFTLSAWVYVQSTSADQVLIAKSTGSGNNYYFLELSNTNNDVFRFVISDNDSTDTVSSTTTASLNTWYHLVASYDATQQKIRIFVNGKLESETAATAESTFANTQNFTVGALTTGSNALNGKIDEVRIYKRAFTGADSLALYNYAPGPITHWKFEDKSSTVTDSSGIGYNGTITGSTSILGKSGNGILLDGVDDHVTNASYAQPFIVTTSAWIKPTVTLNGSTTGMRGFVIKNSNNSNANGKGFFLGYFAGQLSWWAAEGAAWHGVSYTTNFNAGTWYHVAGTYDGITFKLYLDGKLVASLADSGYITYDASPLWVGRSFGNSGTQYFAGVVDEVKIYNYDRSESQIIQDMQSLDQSAAFSLVPNPLIYIPLDENQGQVIHNKGLGGSALNGTLGASATVTTDDPTWQPSANCKANSCSYFDGGDHLVLESNASLLSSSTFTISAWVKVTSIGTLQKVFYRRAANNAINFSMYIAADGTVGVGHTNAEAALTSSTQLTANNWYHLVGTWDGTTRKIYINGKLDASGTSATAASTGAMYTEVGRDPIDVANRYYLTGYIDEIKMYPTVLNAQQIMQDFNSGFASNYGTIGNQEASIVGSGAGNSPIASWDFDEKQNNTCQGGVNDVCDKSGNSYHGLFFDAPSWVRGKNGSAVSLDGSNDYIGIGQTFNSSLVRNTPFSISAWIKPKTVSINQSIVSNADMSSPYIGIEFLVTSTGVLRFDLSDTASTLFRVSAPAATITAGSWQHVMVTYDGSGSAAGIKLYKNGKLLSSTIEYNTANTNAVSTTDFQIGSRDGANQLFSGEIDEVKIYNYQRAASQVAYDFNRGGPILHWKMDECQDTTLNDSSGNGNNGTVTIAGSGTTSVGSCGVASTAWGDGATGKFSASLKTDGTDDYASASLDGTTLTSLTVSFWAKPGATQNSQRGLFQWANSLGSASPFILIARESNASNLKFYVDGNYRLTTPTLANDAWGLITLTLNTSNLWSFYLNGELVGTHQDDGTHSNQASASIVYLANGFYSYFNGQFDDFKVYNYALSIDQIKQLYNGSFATYYGP